ncbi:hypothetical protein L3Q72_06170 [Vibrio sp. JC009]|uniref:hypothetical protein n=1 Tax=Vibrio sp. JC009 TaxID=2912314 RepID=UPI0023AEDE89|nr:hypothetical protein [Vibrio sp. JC009]WED22977.1 hypothetical protein L3Q72_06170 [Vibrio sp. JC009]
MKKTLLLPVLIVLPVVSWADLRIFPEIIEIGVTQGSSNPLFDALPPEPGTENNTTLAGVDFDNDGVRDDIQRAITFEYAEQEATRLALLDSARLLQSILIDSDEVEKSRVHSVEFVRVNECLWFIEDETQPDSNLFKSLIAAQMNTLERSEAYIQYQRNISGEIFNLRDERRWRASCSFDAESILGLEALD